MGIYDAIKDAASIAQKADNIELYRSILDVQKMALDMQQEIIDLREENKKLKEELATNEQLLYHETGYYTTVDEDKKMYYYCSICWDTEKILVHIPKPKASLELGERYFMCKKCKSYIKDGR